MEARRLWAGLHLLDRQLVDRDGRMAGMVDDLELDYSEDKGQLYVVSILSGPGALANRFSRDAFGGWMRFVHGRDILAVRTTRGKPTSRDPKKQPASAIARWGNSRDIGPG